MIRKVDTQWLSGKINKPSIKAIARQVALIIQSGKKPEGVILPQVKQSTFLFDHSCCLMVAIDALRRLLPHKPLTLGHHFPERIIHIRCHFKAYAAALSLAVLSVPKKILNRLQSVRAFSSRGLITTLLTEADIARIVKVAQPLFQHRLLASF